MKTINEGTVNNAPLWNGVSVSCPKCGFFGELESQDNPPSSVCINQFEQKCHTFTLPCPTMNCIGTAKSDPIPEPPDV